MAVWTLKPREFPDHWVLRWSLALAGSQEVLAAKLKCSGSESGTDKHLIVPRDYLACEGDAIDQITNEFRSVSGEVECCLCLPGGVDDRWVSGGEE